MRVGVEGDTGVLGEGEIGPYLREEDCRIGGDALGGVGILEGSSGSPDARVYFSASALKENDRGLGLVEEAAFALGTAVEIILLTSGNLTSTIDGRVRRARTYL